MDDTRQQAPPREQPRREYTLSGAALAAFVLAELLCTALIVVLFL